MSREQDSVAAEVEQIARAMYYFGDWDTYAVEAQKNYWRGKARLAIAALAALSHPQAASSTQAGDLERAVVAFGELQYECGKAYALVGCGKAEDSAFTNAAVRCDRAQAELVATIRRLASSTTPASGGVGTITLTDAEQAAFDAMRGGAGFMLDGKRIPPERVQIVTAPPATRAPVVDEAMVERALTAAYGEGFADLHEATVQEYTDLMRAILEAALAAQEGAQGERS